MKYIPKVATTWSPNGTLAFALKGKDISGSVAETSTYVISDANKQRA